MNQIELSFIVLATISVAGFMLVRQSGRGPLPYVAAFVAYMGLGPVINYLMGVPIYFGVVTEYIPAAARGYLLAVGGLLIASSLSRPSRAPKQLEDGVEWSRRYGFLIGILLALSAVYAGAIIATKGPSLLGTNKLVALTSVGSLHYPYLLAELILAACYLLIRASPRVSRIFWINIGIYVVYCLVTSERDFVLVLVALAMQSRNQHGGPRLLATVGAAVIGAVFATGLFVVRGGDAGPSLLAGVLGQGSLLFVDTQVLNYVPQYEPYAWGSTYLDSGFSAVGLGAWASRGSLAEWLVDIYAPGSSGGYGFSMIAEVTMNFSQWGILPAFLLLGVVITRLTKTSGNSAFAAFMKVFLVVFVPYMLRSDSVGLFSGVVSAILFFVFLSVFTKGETTAARED